VPLAGQASGRASEGMEMARYEVRYFNHGNHLCGSQPFEAENDIAAIRHCKEKLKSPFGKGHEIWQDERFVYRESYRGSDKSGSYNG
jgi:hypothetical protein